MNDKPKRPVPVGGCAKMPRMATTADATNRLPHTRWLPAAWYWAKDADAYMDYLETENKRLNRIIDKSWEGYGGGDVLDWDCDCPVCVAIRAATLKETP